MNIHYLETLTLEVPFRCTISFSGRINVQCISSLISPIYCQKHPSEQRCSVRKVVLKDFVNFKTPMLESLFNRVAGLTIILKNIRQRLLLHCTRTTHCYLSVLPQSQEITQSGNFRGAIVYVIARLFHQCQAPQSAQIFFPPTSAVHYSYHLKSNNIIGQRETTKQYYRSKGNHQYRKNI